MTNLIGQLQQLQDQVNAREESFLKHFTPYSVELLDLWFNSAGIRILYLLRSGDSVAHSVGWTEFNQWLNEK